MTLKYEAEELSSHMDLVKNKNGLMDIYMRLSKPKGDKVKIESRQKREEHGFYISDSTHPKKYF